MYVYENELAVVNSGCNNSFQFNTRCFDSMNIAVCHGAYNVQDAEALKIHVNLSPTTQDDSSGWVKINK